MAVANVIYHHFPHYRLSMMRELVRNGKHKYRFWEVHIDIDGVSASRGDDVVKVHQLYFRKFGCFRLVSGFWFAVVGRKAEIVRSECRESVAKQWTPDGQRIVLDSGVDEILSFGSVRQ